MLDIPNSSGGGPEATNGAAWTRDAVMARIAGEQRQFPPFDFYKLPLSLTARHQLSNVYKTRRCWQLADLLRKHAFDPGSGYYVPLSADIYLVRKLPEVLRQLTSEGHDRRMPLEATFFTNALLIPEGYGSSGLDRYSAPHARFRVTNVGHLVATHEFDCRNIEELEQILGWARGEGGEVSNSLLARWDDQLSRYRDYRGYTVVFTGARSLHFHFIFSTQHLVHAPSKLSAIDRLKADWESQSALMHNAHMIYWDQAYAALCNILEPPCPTDRQLRSVTQWRRAPWGVRILEKDAPILGLRKGTLVPQLVLRERILTKAPKNSADYAVPPDFNLFSRLSRGRSKQVSDLDRRQLNRHCGPMLEMLQEICAGEWQSAYPKPATIERQNGEWLIKFYNHEHDQNPSTIALGEHRRLLLAGRHSYSRDFYLPDQMTAQELGNHVYARCGGHITTAPAPVLARKLTQSELSTQPPQCWIAAMGDSLSNPVDIIQPRDQLAQTYRKNFTRIISNLRVFSNPYVIKSVEGFGKTTGHFPLIASEAFDGAVASYRGENVIQRFGCFAFRSHEQACQKAAEFRTTGRNAIVVQGFRRVYETTCSELGEHPLPVYFFHDASPHGILAEIRQEQPSVFERLEEIRTFIWKYGRFDAATTMLFTTHALVRSWQYGRITRTWHHPNFDPDEDRGDLRDQFALSKVVFDELEMDEFLHILPQSLYDLIERYQGHHADWRNLPRLERYNIFSELCANGEILSGIDFEKFNELMRLELSDLEAVEVNYGAIPFGNDNTPKGIYRREHGKRFYIGIQEWPFTSSTHFAFLTTEHLITDILTAIYDKQYRKRGFTHNPLLRLDLDNVPGIYPVQVPLYIDRRAAADRVKPKVSELAQEIVSADPHAIVISNGVDDQVKRVITFQKAKGQNDLQNKNIFIILTNLAPAQYAQLNVVGQWLNVPDIIQLYYEDQINQAVGRNRGFRDNGATQTAIIASHRLYRNVLDQIGAIRGATRTQMYKVVQRPW
jgi:hypothetical protein